MKARDREPTLEYLILTTIVMLIGKEGKDFSYYENDPGWWALRLYISRN